MKKTQATATALAATLGATLVLGAAPATADSPVITASGGQCEATWLSGTDQFRIRDNDTADSDFCYVDFNWTQAGVNDSSHYRVQAPQDQPGYKYFGVGVGDHKTIYWKVCKERQNDPDICGSIRSDAV